MRTNRSFYICWSLIALMIVAGIGLTLYSALGLCSSKCTVGHLYRIYGFPFETVGFFYFGSLATLHLLTLWNRHLLQLTYLLIIGGLGSEALFLLVQKYWIGHWCPICVSIATNLAIGALTLKTYFAYQQNQITEVKKDHQMNRLWKGTSTFGIFVLGFLFAFLGVSQVNPLETKVEALKNQLTFGNEESPIEVYVFTDWACPACRRIEPQLEAMAPDVMQDSKLYFIDYVIHPETLNYSPYNISFMIHNKPKYLLLRHILTQLSTKTGSPSEDQVEAIAEKVHTEYSPISYSEVATATKYFKDIGTKFSVHQTPTVIIVNTETKQGKRLEGSDQVKKENVLQAISTLRKGNR